MTRNKPNQTHFKTVFRKSLRSFINFFTILCFLTSQLPMNSVSAQQIDLVNHSTLAPVPTERSINLVKFQNWLSDISDLLIAAVRAAPSAPVLKSPVNNSRTADTTPTFTWNASTGATGFKFMIDDTSTFTAPLVFSSSVISGTSITLKTALPRKAYYWRVRACNSGGCGPWSTTWKVTVDTTPPLAPTLSGPINKKITNDNTPSFSWNSVLNAVKYQIQISASSTFATMVINKTLSKGIVKFTATTLNDAVYYWRVRGLNSIGTVGAWSAVRTFTVDTIPPDAPVLSMPEDDATIRGTPKYEWLAVTGAKYYQFAYAISSDFSDVVFTSTLLSVLYKTPPPQLPGAYYWHVRARDAAGNWSSWSTSRIITIKPPLPVAPSLIAPSNGITIITAPVAFSWGQVDNGTNYVIQVDNTEDFSSPEVEVTTSLTTNTPAFLSNSTYYWRVRAQNSLDELGEWSSTWSFTLNVPEDITPPSNPTGLHSTSHTVNVFSENSDITVNWNDDANDGTGSGVVGFSVVWDNTENTLPDDTVDLASTVLTTTSSTLLDETWYFHLRTCDLAGNCSEAIKSGPYKIDRHAPNNPTTFSSSTHVVDTPSKVNTVVVNWSTDANDGSGSGVSGYSLLWDHSASTTPDSVIDYNTSITTTNSGVLSDGSWYVHLRTCDILEHCSIAIHLGPFVIDTTPPTNPSNVYSTSHTVEETNTTDNTIDITWTADANDGTGSGVAGVSVVWDNLADTIPDETIEFVETIHSTTSAGVANGSWYFHLRTCDAAGNCASPDHIGPFLINITDVSEVCGTYSVDTTWTYENSPYIVTCSVVFDNGATLNIEPGVIVKFWYTSLSINGTLNAIGTEADPIVFTSFRDDTYGGDTNLDGATSPAPGDWYSITGNGPTAILNFDHVIARYGGQSNSDYPASYNPILGVGYSPNNYGTSTDLIMTIDHSLIEFSKWSGITIYDNNGGSSLTVTNSIIRNNNSFGGYGIIGKGLNSASIQNNTLSNYGDYGIDFNQSGSISVIGNNISGFSQYGIYIYNSPNTSTVSGNTFTGGQYGLYFSATGLVLTQNNFINQSVAATDLTLNGPFTLSDNSCTGPNRLLKIGGTVYNDLTLDATVPVYEIPYPSLIIADNHNLTIVPGTVIKLSSSSISINGTLNAIGTEADPIVFTSFRDDTYGGDTNLDGATSPAPGDWYSITGNGPTAILNFDHVIARYGGFSSSGYPYSYSPMLGVGYSPTWGTSTTDLSLTINHSVIEYSSWNGIATHDADSGSSLTVTNSIIRNNSGGGVSGSGLNSFNATNNVIYGNTTGIFNNSSVIADARGTYWGSNDGPAPYGSGDAINNIQEWDTECQCYITYPAVKFNPWRDSAGDLVGPPLVQSGAAPSSTTTLWEADPVNVVFGNYVHQSTDLEISTRGLPISFQRTYNSSTTDTGSLGLGWTHSYDMKIQDVTTNTVVVKREDGRLDQYTKDSAGNFIPPSGIHDTLRWVTDHFVLTRKDQVKFTFNPDNTLASLADRNGNQTTLSYTDGKLSAITMPDGREVSLTYSGSLLTQISDPLERTVGFAYSGNLLISSTDANGETTNYGYDTSNRLQTITDANGHTFINNIYNTIGKVVEQRDALNHLTSFAYDTENRRTTVTNPLGGTTIHQYDSLYRSISVTNPLGKTEYYSYDADNNRTSVTDRNGHITRYTFDTRGNMLTSRNALGGTSTKTYDAKNNLLSNTDENGHTTNFSYDPSGNLLTSTNPLGHTVTNTYYSDTDRLGKIHTTTDARGYTTVFDHNANGDLISITDPLDNVFSYSYDAVGRKLSYTDARENTWTYTYDNLNRPLTETDPLGGVTIKTYDPVGNMVSSKDANHKITAFAYNSKDKLVSKTDPGGYTTQLAYDAMNNKISETDGNNHTTTFGYDAANQLTSVTNPLGKTTTYGYDNAGNQTRVTDPLDHTTTTVYDVLNRPIQVIDPLSHTTSTSYDAVSNVLSVTDPNNHLTAFTYNDINQLATVTDALGGVFTYGYDPNGNRTSMEDANHHITNYLYDPLNRLSRTTDPLGHFSENTYDGNGNQASATDPNGNTTLFTFNKNNRLTRIAYNDATSVSFTLDAVGNRLEMVDSLGTTSYTYDDLYRPLSIDNPTGVTSFTYDAKNRLTVTTPAGTATYTYDAADQLLTLLDWQGQATSYAYDAAGRPTTTTYPNGAVTTNSYDDASRLTGISTIKDAITLFSVIYTLDNVGNRLSMTDTDGTTSYAYDVLDRLSTVAYPSGTPTNVSYTYDPVGNRLTVTKDGVTTSYAYNDADELITTTTGMVSVNNTWDNAGNLLTKGDQTYTWNRAGKLASLTAGSINASYQYNGDGVRLARTVDGVTTNYLQDLSGGLPVVLRETTGSTPTNYVYGTDLVSADSGSLAYYHSDGLGSTRALTNASGEVTDRYSYDAFGAKRNQTGISTQSFTYTGEQVDPEAGLVYLRARYYDPEVGRFISKDKFKGLISMPASLNHYTYSQNNPITHFDRNGEFVVTIVALAIFGIGFYASLTDFYKSADTAGSDLAVVRNYDGEFDDSFVQRQSEAYRKFSNEDIPALQKSAWDLSMTSGTSLSPSLPGLPSTWKGLAFDLIKDWAIKLHFNSLGSKSNDPKTSSWQRFGCSGCGFGGGGGGSWGDPIGHYK